MQATWLLVSEPVVADGEEGSVGAGFFVAAVEDEPLVDVSISVFELDPTLLSAYHALVEADIAIV